MKRNRNGKPKVTQYEIQKELDGFYWRESGTEQWDGPFPSDLDAANAAIQESWRQLTGIHPKVADQGRR